MIQIIYSDHLAHHGVKGMKWGVRRYQNYDGTRIGAKSSSTFKKSKTETQTYDYGGIKGSYSTTTYSNRSSSGRKKMDSEVNKEFKEAKKIAKEYGYELDKNEIGSSITGGDLTNKFVSEGISFVEKVESQGYEYAEEWLKTKSSLKDYDYEISVNDETIDTGEKFVSASLKVYGDEFAFKAGVEKDYSDDEWFYERNPKTDTKIRDALGNEISKEKQSELKSYQNKSISERKKMAETYLSGIYSDLTSKYKDLNKQTEDIYANKSLSQKERIKQLDKIDAEWMRVTAEASEKAKKAGYEELNVYGGFNGSDYHIAVTKPLLKPELDKGEEWTFDEWVMDSSGKVRRGY